MFVPAQYNVLEGPSTHPYVHVRNLPMASHGSRQYFILQWVHRKVCRKILPRYLFYIPRKSNQLTQRGFVENLLWSIFSGKYLISQSFQALLTYLLF